MVAIQILSDLHLEAPKAYDVFEIVPNAPYLALLGDIGNVVKDKKDFFAFITVQLRQFRAVLFVPGNHEAYGSNWNDTVAALESFEQEIRTRRATDEELGEFVLLDRGVFKVPGSDVVILGCSLFSFVPPERMKQVSFSLNDFYSTTEWTIEDHNESHKRDVAWLNMQFAELEKQVDVQTVAVFTHWTPTMDPRSIEPRFLNSPINSAFNTDLSSEACWKSAKLKVWAFGHTHYNCDFEAEREGGKPVRLLGNQRGYFHVQSGGFDNQGIVEL